MSEGFDEFLKKLERRLREVENEFRREFERIFQSIERHESRFTERWSVYGEVIEPLYTIRDVGDRIIVYIDLPFASEGTIDVRFEGRRMNVYAKLKSSIKLGEWSERYRGIEVKEYRTSIDLPFEPKPDKTRVRVRKGIAEIIIYK